MNLTTKRVDPIRVVLVEDDVRFRDRVIQICGNAPTDVILLAVFPTAEAARLKIPLLAPDVALVDVRLPAASGIELIQELANRMPGTHFVVLTAIPDWDCIYEAIRVGALGYLLKRESEEHLIELIRNVKAGGSPMTNSIARKVLQAFRKRIDRAGPENFLTPREEAVVVSFAQGLSNKEIAEKLGISVGTVRTHAQNIFKKLNVRSRRDAVSALEEQRTLSP